MTNSGCQHKKAECKGQICCFHNPSQHHMNTWPMTVRYDRGGMTERLCSHGVGHPDPDSLKWLRSVGRNADGIHGCCGCCTLSSYLNILKTLGIRGRIKVREIVKKIRQMTFCIRCGRQPIDWHNEEHIQNPYRRVWYLAQNFPLKIVISEIEQCTPLCRSCHMKEDGRLDWLHKNKPNQPGSSKPRKPCKLCAHLFKPLRRELCYRCYENHRVGGRAYKGHSYSNGCCLSINKERE